MDHAILNSATIKLARRGAALDHTHPPRPTTLPRKASGPVAKEPQAGTPARFKRGDRTAI